MNTYMGPICLASAASIWGGMYVVSKVVMGTVSPMELLWLRYLIAAAVLFVMGRMMKVSWKIERKDIPLIVLISFLGYVISVWTQFEGTNLSSAQTGSVLTAASPACMIIFARILLHEMITFRKSMAVLLATAGVFLIIGIEHITGPLDTGAALLIISALTWALISVWIKKIPSRYSMLTVTEYAMLTALLILTPIELPDMGGLLSADIFRPEILAGILYIGVFSTAAAFYLWNKGMQMVSASTGGIYFFFQPLVGTLGGWFFLGEPIGLPFLIGTSCILISIFLAVGGDGGSGSAKSETKEQSVSLHE